MITPRFKLHQTDNTVTIIIRAPYCNLREIDVQVDDDIFLFYCSPYHLRLHLPGRLVDDDHYPTTSGEFNSDTGEFTFNYKKTIPGEHFPDLDMITKLLCPKIELNHHDDDDDKIVVLTNNNEIQIDSDHDDDDDDDKEGFGFAMRGKRNFKYVCAEFREVFEIDPREVRLDERHKLRLQQEQKQFNIDHYICDYIENDEIVEIINLKSPFDELKKDEQIEFTDKELDFLKDLQNLNYNNLNVKQLNYCYYGLIDILYAYCYDRRTTYFEGTSESCWNLNKLSATLCWLDGYQDLKETLICCYRRALIYPLYRNFQLNLQIFNDLKQLLKCGGEKYLIKCLIEIHGIFLSSNYCCYILNNLFIKDYIVFIMKWDQTRWWEIIEQLDKITIDKKDLGLNLIEIEDGIGGDLSQITNLTIKDDDSDDTATSSESSSSSSDDDDD